MRTARAIVLTALSGVLYGLAFPPARLWPLAWFALTPFLVAVRESGPWAAASLGGLLGVAVSYGVGDWMPRAVVRYYQQPLPIGVLVFFGCALLQASWQYGFFAIIVRNIHARQAALAPLLIAAAWVATELARAKPAIGNPWALSGYSQAVIPIIVQVADLAGVYAVGF